MRWLKLFFVQKADRAFIRAYQRWAVGRHLEDRGRAREDLALLEKADMEYAKTAFWMAVTRAWELLSKDGPRELDQATAGRLPLA